MKKLLIVAAVFLLVLLGALTCGALDVVRRGGGFLFIPSHTPTQTPTATATPTAEIIYTTAPAVSFFPEPSMTETAVPSDTPTPLPTVDVTALAEEIAAEIYLRVTEEIGAFYLKQTPSPTPVIPDSELYTGLRKINPANQKELFYIRSAGSDHSGFWIDLNEVTNGEYWFCVQSGYCSAPSSDVVDGNIYYSDWSRRNYPVVNITRGQASAYCSWSGMQLMSGEDWVRAAGELRDADENIDARYGEIREIDPLNSDITGNVWEWIADDDPGSGRGLTAGGSWKSSLQDVRGGRFVRMEPNRFAEDVGFRCVSYVY